MIATSYSLVDAPRTVPGWTTLRETRVLGRGRGDLESAVVLFRSGQAHRAAGITFRRSGDDVHMRLLGLSFHCRVLRDDVGPGEYVFTYKAAPGHVERGEESFVVRIGDDGTVTGFITAVSRPNVAPVRFLQRVIARRYLVGMTPGR